MAEAIWKFEIETTDRQIVEMPIGAKILTVQTQNGCPCLWAVVNPDAKKVLRGIEVFGTGHPMPAVEGERREYIGTYQLSNGMFIFHVFEVIGDLRKA